MILSVYLRALLYKKSFWLGASSPLTWAHTANIMLQYNLRGQQKYNKFTVHGKLQPIASKLYMKCMNAVQCLKAISTQIGIGQKLYKNTTIF